MESKQHRRRIESHILVTSVGGCCVCGDSLSVGSSFGGLLLSVGGHCCSLWVVVVHGGWVCGQSLSVGGCHHHGGFLSSMGSCHLWAVVIYGQSLFVGGGWSLSVVDGGGGVVVVLLWGPAVMGICCLDRFGGHAICWVPLPLPSPLLASVMVIIVFGIVIVVRGCVSWCVVVVVVMVERRL